MFSQNTMGHFQELASNMPALAHIGSACPLAGCLSLPGITTRLGNAAQWGQGHSDREPSYCRWPLFLWKPLITSALDGGKPSEGVLLLSTVCAWSGEFRVAAGSCGWRNQATCPTPSVCAVCTCRWSHMGWGHTLTRRQKANRSCI